jgi:hypothetical protein
MCVRPRPASTCAEPWWASFGFDNLRLSSASSLCTRRSSISRCFSRADGLAELNDAIAQAERRAAEFPDEPPQTAEGLDPDVARALQHPQIRQAVETSIAQAQQAAHA